MLDKKEIEDRLKDIDPQLCVAFAARCSLRVLPLLVADKKKENFWYWGKDERSTYVLHFLRAQQFSFMPFVFDKENRRPLIAHDILDGIAHAVHKTSKASKACYAVFTTTYSTVAFSEAAYSASDVTLDSTNAYNNAVLSTNHAGLGYIKEMSQDLDWVTNKRLSNKKIFLTDFLYSPLWGNSVNKDWEDLFSRFYQALLYLDSGFEPWIDWYKDRVAGKPLDKDLEEKWLNIPPEIREQGVKATNNYLASLVEDQQKKSLKPLNLVRAIFIGNGAAGKTSLIRKLHYEPVVEGKEEMTPGIEIREWSLPESDIKAKFWDFGGQVMSHSTHQFFLRERCLYILVLDARTEFNANDQAEYWLEHVKAFGNNAPVMLVGNKSDLTAVNLDMNALQEKYQNIVGFYPVSCTSNKAHFTRRFNLFHDDLVEQLTSVSTRQVMFNKDQFKVLKKVRKLSRTSAFLDYEKFNTLCKKHEIGKKGLSQKDFLGVLDSLGEIIHFPDLDWAEAYVLNPRWLTYGVYTLLYSDRADKQQGVLSEADVVEILHPKVVKDENGNKLKFPKNKCRFIVDAMSNFKLCYRLPEDNKCFVIPDKLPTEQPKLKQYFDKSKEGTLTFEFNFKGLLPRNIMPNLIVARHKEIVKDKKGKQLVWQHGVIINNTTYEATARLQVDYHQRTLQLWIQGKEPREYLVVLRDEIYKILNAIKGLSVKENIVLPGHARVNKDRFILGYEDVERATYKSVIEQAKAGRKVIFSDAGNQYDLEQVMGFIMTKERQNKEGTNVTYNIETVGALGGVGDKHRVQGQVNILKAADKKVVKEFQESITELMQQVENHDTDFKTKASAYAELEQISTGLTDLEDASPETKGKLHKLITNMKDGTLGAIKLGKEFKEGNELAVWLMERAAIVAALPIF